MASSIGNRVPLITGILAALLVAGFVWPTSTPEGAVIQAERAREEALEFYRRHSEVSLTPRDRALIGSEYVESIDARRAAGDEERTKSSARARARNQARFEALLDEALLARRGASRAWRFAVDPGDPVSSKFLGYAFFHGEPLAFAVSLAFLVVAGVGLELAWGSLFFAFFCSVLQLTVISGAGYAFSGIASIR